MNTTVAPELIDRVDEDDRVVGTVLREDALPNGANFRTAHVFIRNSVGHLLMQRLARTRKRHPGRWGSSVAAYVRTQESYLEAAARRLREELCLELELREAGMISMSDQDSIKFVGLFTAISERAEVCDRDQIDELRFWPPGELSKAADSTPEQFTPTFLRLFHELA